MEKKTSIRTTYLKAYVCPETTIIGMSDFNPSLLASSIGQFEDMEPGGSLGDDDNEGSFDDMEWGGDLGGTVTGN